MKEKNRIRGKKARESGQRFERKVRKDLESKGWIVDRWSNNVNMMEVNDLTVFKDPESWEKVQWINKHFGLIGELIPAKRKFNPFKKALSIGTGFPDFIAFRLIAKDESKEDKKICFYEIIGVEVKSDGYLDKTEKLKCQWLLDNNIFSKILIASKSEVRGKINYKEFKMKKVPLEDLEKVVCTYQHCDARGAIGRCYMNQFPSCKRYKFYITYLQNSQSSKNEKREV